MARESGTKYRVNQWKKNHRQRRYAGMEEMLSELGDCVPSGASVEGEIEEREMTEIINAWLGALSEKDRDIFVSRYWAGEAVNALAAILALFLMGAGFAGRYMAGAYRAGSGVIGRR